MEFVKLLKSKRYNCSTIARELNVAPQTVWRWKMKHATPNPLQIKQMSELLGVSTDEVINSLLEK